MSGGDFFQLYFSYAKEKDGSSEAPDIFHRWSAIAGLGALLGRRFQFQHGHMLLNPNIYCMLIGLAGTKKSTAIKLFKKVLVAGGYRTFAAEKTTKEKFLLDLVEADESPADIMNQNLFGDTDDDADAHTPAECFIAADEFNEFFGNNGLEFVSLLGSLWDFSGTYKSKVKNSQSITIYNPTISILGGNTPTGFNAAFPIEILGQGFFSRLLLIYGEPTGKKITFPRTPSISELSILCDTLKEIKLTAQGFMQITPSAERLLDKIYKSWRGIDDVRFDSYSNRRFTHLLKLCLIHAAAKLSKELTDEIVIYAHTVLTYAENYMSKALGEFGKARHADTVHKIIQLLEKAKGPLEIKDIWKNVNNDLDKYTELGQILANLVQADKIIKTGFGFVLKRKAIDEGTEGTVDYSMLTKQEQERL